MGTLDTGLEAVWMLPDGIEPRTPLSAAVVGVLVQVRDAGFAVRLDGATQASVEYVASVLEAWTGGARA